MPRTQIERLWIGCAAAGAMLVAVVGYFFLISPQQASTASVREQVANAQLQESTLRAHISSLASQQRHVSSYRAALVAARAALPTAGDASAAPTLLRAVHAIAHTTSTTISTMTVGAPSPIVAAVPAATTATTAAAPATSAAPTTAAPGAVATSSVYSVPISASINGSVSNLSAFLDALRTGQPRALLITAVSLDSAVNAHATGAFTLELTMSAFVRPSVATALPVTTLPTTPSATPSATTTP